MDLIQLGKKLKAKRGPASFIKIATEYFMKKVLYENNKHFYEIADNVYALDTKTGCHTFKLKYYDDLIILKRMARGCHLLKHDTFLFEEYFHIVEIKEDVIADSLEGMFKKMYQKLRHLWVNLQHQESPAPSVTSDQAIQNFTGNEHEVFEDPSASL